METQDVGLFSACVCQPDKHESFGAINTGVMLRAIPGDTNDWPELRGLPHEGA